MLRIDTHHHVIPPDYRKALQKAGLIEAGGRELPEWSPETSLQAMADLDVSTAILSVSTPGTAFLPNPADAAALARDLNDYTAELAAAHPDRFGFFATVPMPHIVESVAEVVRSLDELNADGVVLLANNAGTYLGEHGQDRCSPPSTNDQRWCSFTQPSCRVPRCPASHRSRRTSCSTPLAPHTYWCAMEFVPNIPTSASS